MAIQFVKRGGSSSGNIPLNIFCQDAEPDIKKGVWLQTNKSMEKYIFDDNIFFGGNWLPAINSPSELPHNFYGGASVAIDTDIYIFGTYESGYRNYAYKYNTSTDTYTRLTNIPYNFYYGAAVAIGTDIYLFGGNGSHSSSYKYNISSNTYSQLSNIPFEFYKGVASTVGTDIYLFGSEMSAYTYYAYKYNTLTKSYTRMTDSPIAFRGAAIVTLGTDIYIFGSGSGGNYAKQCYKYNPITNAYTQLTNIPYYFYTGAATAIGIKIYILGGEGGKKTVRVYASENKTYDNNTLVIAQGKTYNVGYNTEILSLEQLENNQLLYGFADAWFYTTVDGLITNIPTYYGNGTQWIKIKN